MLKAANRIFNIIGLEIVKKKHLRNISDMEPDFHTYLSLCKSFTMTSPERMYALYKSVEYITGNAIKGDIVECGVWKGGSSMMAAYSLKHFNDTSRKIYLYDTFEGMSAPTDHDRDLSNKTAEETYKESLEPGGISTWCYSPLDEVKANIVRTGYPAENLVFVKGKVEDTIPSTIPGEIALLRLDTDWYESTLHELVHLFPRLQKGGILILDDYGHWKGARKAADEYFSDHGITPFLSRIDYTGRAYVKMK